MFLNNSDYSNYNELTLVNKKSIELLDELFTNINNNYFTYNIKNNINSILLYIRKMKFSQKPNYKYIIKNIL